MPILIIITTIICVFAAFLAGSPANDNAFFAYCMVIWNFFTEYWIYVVLGFLIACILFIRSVKFGSEYSRTTKYIFSAFQVGGSIFTGTFFAYVILLCIAWVELNGLALVIDINPSFLGIISDTPTIISTIKSHSVPPQIIASDTDNYGELLGIATTTTGTTNVYGNKILTSVPSLLVLPIIQPTSSMLLIDNTLIVTKISRGDLQKITPIIGNLLVQQYFPTRKIKAYPNVQVMTPAEYEKTRTDEYAAKLSKIGDELKTIASDISSTSAHIQYDKDLITTTQSAINQTSIKNEKQYTDCINAGYYNGNEFLHYNSRDYCQRIRDNQETIQQTTTNDLTTWQKQLSYDQEQLASYEYYQKFFTAQKQVMQVTKANIPFELGLFLQPNNVQIVVTSKGTHIIANYFETVAHEYLHYASYIPNKQFVSTFFEEGLTEYFARQTIKDNFHVDTNLGYPVYVKIISEMTKIIPESELADIYFAKDEKRLEKTLDRVYGDGFYSKNLILFETLQFASDPTQVLELANTIMKRINGNSLNLQDLQSASEGL